jgi:hypothetical protein
MRSLTLAGPAIGMALAWAAPARADVVWTLLDVQARLDDAGRLHVVETHHLRLEDGLAEGLSLFREFGLGADQSLVLHRLTRMGPGAEEVPLERRDVSGPDEFQYYALGHAHYSIPPLPPGSELALRFEYEVVNAVAPAFGIGAAPGPLGEEWHLASPIARARQILADWREARPDPQRRYRLDHDVLFPSRDGPAFQVRQVDYRLEYAEAWRMVDPEAELATVIPDVSYRVRQLFEYLPEGRPSGAAFEPAVLRLASIAALLLGAAVLWLALLAIEGLGTRGKVDRAFVEETLRGLAPEQVSALAGEVTVAPDPERLLVRLALERKLAIEVRPPADPDGEPEVRLRLLVPPSAQGELEREFLEPLFSGRTEVSSTALAERYAEEGFDPRAHLESLLRARTPTEPRGRLSLAALPFAAVALAGVGIQLHAVVALRDVLPLVAVANALTAMGLLGLWPGSWWHGARPRRSAVSLLLLPLGALLLAVLAFELAFERPLPAQAWAGAAIAAGGAYGVVLARSRMPSSGDPWRTRRALARVARYARAELRRARPRLDDRWIPHLEALGLGPEVARWHTAHGGVASLAPELGTAEAHELHAAPPFTGRAAGFVAPPGWADALYVLSREEREEIEREEAEEEEA